MSLCAHCKQDHPADGPCPALDPMATQAGRPSAAIRRGTPLTPARSAGSAGDALPRLGDSNSDPAVAGALAVAAAADDVLRPGAQIGEYELTEKIGEGGMGVVWGGVHPMIGKRVAIKLLNPGLSQDPTIVQRFLQEARAVNQIGHRNIVDIFAFGQLSSGRHYFVMEHLKGVSLKARLEREPRLTYRDAYVVLAEVADALAAAHAQGIVHRDLKPDNIYLCDADGDGPPQVKLLDFGIAKLLRRGEEGGMGQTRTGAPIGTPYYMAPEQCRSKNVDARTDLYAMGVIMFEMFCGRVPLAGADYIDTVNAHLSTAPPLPTDFAEMPVELEALILASLEKDPDRRPQSAEELRATLRQLASTADDRVLPPAQRHPGVAATAASHPSGTAHPNPTHPSAPFRKLTPPPRVAPRRRVAAIWIGGALAAAALVAGAWVTATRHRAPAPAAPSATADLEVVTDPPGAAVTLDGRRQTATSPSTFPVPRGRDLVLRLDKEGYRPYDTVVRIDGDVSQKAVLAHLVKLAGQLRAHVNARDARWTLDGAEVGTGATLVVAEAATGAHRLHVEARGFEPRDESIQIAAGAATAIDWSLQPATRRRRPSGASSGTVPDAPNLDFKAPR